MRARLAGIFSESVRLFLLSLAIAVALWVFVGRAPSPEPERTGVGSVVVQNVDVVVQGLSNGFTATPDPRTVDVELGGPATLALRPADVRAFADIARLPPGTHDVTLRVQFPLGVTSVRISPPTVRVKITAR
jgi:YbbR domain-containing protein